MNDGPIAQYVRQSTLDQVAEEARERLAPKLRKRGEFMPWEVHSVERGDVRVAIIAVVTKIKSDGKPA